MLKNVITKKELLFNISVLWEPSESLPQLPMRVTQVVGVALKPAVGQGGAQEKSCSGALNPILQF